MFIPRNSLLTEIFSFFIITSKWNFKELFGRVYHGFPIKGEGKPLYHAERSEYGNMFTGKHRHTVDSKGRLFIPVRLREELGETFMVTRGLQKCLRLYSMEEWDNFLRPIMELPRKTSEATLRFLHRNATQVVPDSQGRILLPQGLVDHAQIKKNAVIVGCGNYAEIWAEALYNKSVEEEDIDAIRAALEEAGL